MIPGSERSLRMLAIVSLKHHAQLAKHRAYVAWKGARRYREILAATVATIPVVSDAACPVFAPLPTDWLRSRGYVSQIGQDYLLDQMFFPRQESGVFVDVGAHDGITYSNRYFLENERSWSGLCIEPNPSIFEQLARNRECNVEPYAVGSHDGFVRFLSVVGPDMLSGVAANFDTRHLSRIDREVMDSHGSTTEILVPMKPLQHLLDAHGISSVDLLCIDTEGSEFDVLKSIDFHRTRVSVILIERNYESGQIPRYLKKAGFVRLMTLGWDDIYVNEDLDFLFGSHVQVP